MARKDADGVDPERAEQALDYLREMSPDMRGGAILDATGNALATSGDRRAWAAAAAGLLEAADRAAAEDGRERAEHVHVATEDGEVFALRQGEMAIVAVTERFALASLMVFDMRAVLRDLAGVGT